MDKTQRTSERDKETLKDRYASLLDQLYGILEDLAVFHLTFTKRLLRLNPIRDIPIDAYQAARLAGLIANERDHRV